jgi:hypothetical protein
VTIQRIPEGTSHEPVRLSSATTGAASELIACAELMRLGYCVYRCESPHAPFDLVAYRDGRCLRVEVKTLAVSEYAPSFTAPTNSEWDLLALVSRAGEVFLFEPSLNVGEIRAAIRTHFGLPAPAEPRKAEQPCGTVAAYARHIRKQEAPCAPCAGARRQYRVSRRALGPTLSDQGAATHTRLGVDRSEGATGLSGGEA